MDKPPISRGFRSRRQEQTAKDRVPPGGRRRGFTLSRRRSSCRRPIGGYFVWTVAMGGPLCLIAGGSGIAPLMAMLRHRERRNSRAPAVLRRHSHEGGPYAAWPLA